MPERDEGRVVGWIRPDWSDSEGQPLVGRNPKGLLFESDLGNEDASVDDFDGEVFMFMEVTGLEPVL